MKFRENCEYLVIDLSRRHLASPPLSVPRSVSTEMQASLIWPPFLNGPQLQVACDAAIEWPQITRSMTSTQGVVKPPSAAGCSKHGSYVSVWISLTTFPPSIYAETGRDGASRRNNKSNGF